MAFNPLKEKGISLDKQIRSWAELAGVPYNKEEVDPYTRARVILMNGIEVESAIFLHEFARNTRQQELRQQLAMVRRMEQQQQKAIAGLVPGDESTLEHTIGYEQVAVDLTAFLSQTVDDDYVKQVFDFGLLEDFDHLYRYANLMETLEGVQAEKIVRDLTEVIPGRPTIAEHRHPFDSIRKPANGKKADPKTILYIMTLTAGEQQTMNFYMNMGNRLTDPIGRGLYTEIGMIEEQHVSQYESLLSPMSWFEMMVCHDYNEAYLYHSFMEAETDPRIKGIWELHLVMELGHLHAGVELMKKYEKKDAAEILPAALPEPIVFRSNVEYVREILETQLNYTANQTEIVPLEELNPDHRYFMYNKLVNGYWVPSEKVIEEHEEMVGGDYRLLLAGEAPVGEVPTLTPLTSTDAKVRAGSDIFTLLEKEHAEAKSLFDKLEANPKGAELVFAKLQLELSSHMQGEEHSFYPELEGSDETRDLTKHSYEEHDEAKNILSEIVGLPFGNKEWQSKLHELRESVEHHVEEEEHALFEKARRMLEDEEAQRIGSEFLMEKQTNSAG